MTIVTEYWRVVEIVESVAFGCKEEHWRLQDAIKQMRRLKKRHPDRKYKMVKEIVNKVVEPYSLSFLNWEGWE